MADEVGSGALAATGGPFNSAAPPKPEGLTPQSLLYRDPAQPPYWQRDWTWTDVVKEPLAFLKSSALRMGDKPTEETVANMVATGGPVSSGALGGGLSFMSGIKDVPALSVVRKAGTPTQVYHGTPVPFAKFEKAKLDKGALYGPGFYFTENPGIASGYAYKNVPYVADKLHDLNKIEESIAYFRKSIADAKAGGLKPHEYSHNPTTGGSDTIQTLEEGLAAWEAIKQRELQKFSLIANSDLAGNPQVKPAYLDVRKPFDIDKGLSPAEIERIAAIAERYGIPERDTLLRLRAERLQIPGIESNPAAYNGDWLYRTLEEAIPKFKENAPTEPMVAGWKRTREPAAIVNRILQQAGYDGITHIGGGRTGNKPHRVWIVFKPEQVVKPYE